MTITIEAQKAFNKIHDKSPEKTRNKRNIPQHKKRLYINLWPTFY
jgi:hypothetical protein